MYPKAYSQKLGVVKPKSFTNVAHRFSRNSLLSRFQKTHRQIFVVCMIYLKISLSDFMTVFAARTNGFFFTQKPGKLLVLAFCAATLASTIFALWPQLQDAG